MVYNSDKNKKNRLNQKKNFFESLIYTLRPLFRNILRVYNYFIP